MFTRKIQELENTRKGNLEISCNLDSAEFKEKEVVTYSNEKVKYKRVLSIDARLRKEITNEYYTVTYHFVCVDEDTMLEDFDNVQEVIDANVEVKIKGVSNSLADKIFNKIGGVKNTIKRTLE